MHTLRAWSATRSKRRPIDTSGSIISGWIFCCRSSSMTSAISLLSRASTAGSIAITFFARLGSCRTNAWIASWIIGIARSDISTIRSRSPSFGVGRLLSRSSCRATLSA